MMGGIFAWDEGCDGQWKEFDMTHPNDVQAEELIERLAQWLHDEVDYPAFNFPDYSWPEHPNDTGQRGDGWLKIVPPDVCEQFRDIARRLPGIASISPPIDAGQAAWRWKQKGRTDVDAWNYQHGYPDLPADQYDTERVYTHPAPIDGREAVEGWQLVPTKHEGRAGLTPEMFDAFWAAFHYSWERHGDFVSVNAGYNAMLAAAPHPAPAPGPAEAGDLIAPVAWRYRKPYPDVDGWTDWLLSSKDPRWHEPDADVQRLYTHPAPGPEDVLPNARISADVIAQRLARFIPPDSAGIEAAEAKAAALTASVERYEARLEIDHCYVMVDGNPELERREVPADERETWPDGITCRDETIRLLEEQIAASDRTAAALRTALEPFAADADNWADTVADDYSPRCTEPGAEYAHPGSEAAFTVGDIRRAAALAKVPQIKDEPA